MAKSTVHFKKPSPEQELIADLLLGLNPALVKGAPKRAGYISLDIQVGKSTNNKNAISISKNGVRFMVADWSREFDARSLGFSTIRIEETKRLKFPGLTSSAIQAHSTFFQTLSAEAEQESRKRQGY